MLTGSAYQLEKNSDKGTFTITQYKVSNAQNIIPRKFVHTYDDNMVYFITQTDNYVKGGYKTHGDNPNTVYASIQIPLTLNCILNLMTVQPQ